MRTRGGLRVLGMICEPGPRTGTGGVACGSPPAPTWVPMPSAPMTGMPVSFPPAAPARPAVPPRVEAAPAAAVTRRPGSTVSRYQFSLVSMPGMGHDRDGAGRIRCWCRQNEAADPSFVLHGGEVVCVGVDMPDEFDRPSRLARSGVTATVKWFNVAKGFGFVQTTPDEPDVFVHASAMTGTEYTNLPQGSTIVCDIVEAQRGLQVSAIHEVDTSTAAPAQVYERSRGPRNVDFGGGGGGGGGGGPEQELTGRVKFYDARKGYGFVAPDEGDHDVFVPGRVLSKTGLLRLESNQRVRLRCREGDRGLLATWVEAI